MAAILEKETKARCEALMDAKVQACFHEVLGMREGFYRDSFRKPIADLVSQGSSDLSMLALVETRIPFDQQRELLGIDKDPANSYKVIHNPSRLPYSVQLVVILGREAFAPGIKSYPQAIENLSGGLRSTTPFEGIGSEIEKILTISPAVLLPGGEYEMPGLLTGGSIRFDGLTLERYLGKIRIGRQRLDTPDHIVGILAART